MDKLRKLQAEKEQREAEYKLQAEKEQREAEYKLEAEKEEREAKLQAEERLKIEEMRTQLELAKIQAQTSQPSEHNPTSGGTRPVREGESSKLRCLNCRLLWTKEIILILGYFGLSEVDGRSWCTSLSALLTGRALETFCRLSENEATDYDRVKEVLQMRYNLTEDGYRQRFRTCAPEEGENPSMFINRLKTYLE